MPKSKTKVKGVTFQLVHRSQQDPLVADENAPQRVLVPIPEKESKTDKEKRLEEQHKYGIYFDDDYNYLQHLKDTKDNRLEWPEHVDEEIKKREQEKLTKTKVNLPSSVFASEVEEEVGMLGKAAPTYGPQLHLDPDVVAAMDDDFDYDDPENQLEDNFIELANGVASDEDFNEEDEDCYMDSEEVDSESLDGSERSFKEEETKSRFTNYSMTSSVIRRNNQLTLLDDRFEKMYAAYEDTEIGALDCEEIEGHIPDSDNILIQCAEEFEKQRKRESLDKDRILEKTKKQLETINSEDENDMEFIEVEEKEKWDCETILSTYSNIYNHPKLITEPKGKIRIDKKTGIPKNVLGAEKLTAKALNQLNEEHSDFDKTGTKSVGGQSIISQISMLSIRPKNETPEERRERKKSLKEYRKERRIERKANTEAFKEEAKRQTKIAINNRNNVQGNKIL